MGQCPPSFFPLEHCQGVTIWWEVCWLFKWPQSPYLRSRYHSYLSWGSGSRGIGNPICTALQLNIGPSYCPLFSHGNHELFQSVRKNSLQWIHYELVLCFILWQIYKDFFFFIPRVLFYFSWNPYLHVRYVLWYVLYVHMYLVLRYVL